MDSNDPRIWDLNLNNLIHFEGHPSLKVNRKLSFVIHFLGHMSLFDSIQKDIVADSKQ